MNSRVHVSLLPAALGVLALAGCSAGSTPSSSATHQASTAGNAPLATVSFACGPILSAQPPTPGDSTIIHSIDCSPTGPTVLAPDLVEPSVEACTVSSTSTTDVSGTPFTASGTVSIQPLAQQSNFIDGTTVIGIDFSTGNAMITFQGGDYATCETATATAPATVTQVPLSLNNCSAIQGPMGGSTPTGTTTITSFNCATSTIPDAGDGLPSAGDTVFSCSFSATGTDTVVDPPITGSGTVQLPSVPQQPTLFQNNTTVAEVDFNAGTATVSFQDGTYFTCGN